MERMACPQCGRDNAMLGVVNDVKQFTCVGCGMIYYAPYGCVTDDKKPGASGASQEK